VRLRLRSPALVSASVPEDAFREHDEGFGWCTEIAVPAEPLVQGATERGSQLFCLVERCFELDECPRQRLSGVGVPVVVAGDSPHRQRDAFEAPRFKASCENGNGHLPKLPLQAGLDVDDVTQSAGDDRP
jgi:hypothetical protein